MKKAILVFACTFLMSFGDSVQSQLVSTRVSFSPTNTTLFGPASRFGHHKNNWSTAYMQYNDGSYFCSFSAFYTTASIVTYCEVSLPDSTIITDMKRFNTNQGFIGSFQNKGMHGWTNPYNSTISSQYNFFYFYLLPKVDIVKRIATKRHLIYDTKPLVQIKAFAIGEKDERQSVLLEFYTEMEGAFAPYLYAPLSCNTVTGECETADDVLIVDEKVVYATRDTRAGHAGINLRISDTNHALLSADINNQWQFWLPANQSLKSELRLVHIEDDVFILAYTIYNAQTGKYYLFTNRIRLVDLLANNNTIVSHCTEIKNGCINLVDVIYEPDVNTMVILLNGEYVSEIYHFDAHANAGYSATKLVYDDVFYSIDTVGEYSTVDVDAYVAMGDSVFFSQDISNGVLITESCLGMVDIKVLLQESPYVSVIKDPITGAYDEKGFYIHSKEGHLRYLTRWCDLFHSNK